MQLWYIDLCISPYKKYIEGEQEDTFSKDEASCFSFRVRFIANYLSKQIRKYHCLTDGTFTKIAIEPTWGQDRFYFFSPYNTLIAYVHIEREQFDWFMKGPHNNEKNEFALSLLERGYQVLAHYKEIPIRELLEVNHSLRANGFINEWVFKKFRIKELGLTVFLHCYFTPVDFRLEIHAYSSKTDELIAKDIILRTPPDEIFFDHTFKQAQIVESRIIIYNFLKHPAFIIDIPKLLYGVVEVKYLKYEKDGDADEIARLIW